MPSSIICANLDRFGRKAAWTCLILACLWIAPHLAAQQLPQPAIIRGRVLDAQSGEGIAKALVSVRQQSLDSVTDAGGAFVLAGVAPGALELYVSTVGYALLKKKIAVEAGQELQIDFLLGRMPLRRTDQVTVTADPFAIGEAGAVSEQTLTDGEMKRLSGVLVDDPLRSVHALPGVATADDSNAKFSLRGSGFNNIGIYLDGILLGSPFHTVDDVQESASLTLFNSDALDSVTLLSGGFPAKYGDRTGAILDLYTREGNREKIVTQADLGITGFAFSNEGPIGKKASWLVSGRKSYLDYLLDKMGNDTMVIGYRDLLGKVSYRPAGKHSFVFSSLIGDAFFKPGKSTADSGEISKAQKQTLFGEGTWDWTLSPSLLLRSQFALEAGDASNHDLENGIPYRSHSLVASWQQALTGQWGTRHAWQAGWVTRKSHENTQSLYRIHLTDIHVDMRYNRTVWNNGAYLQDSWQLIPHLLVLNWGARFEHFSATGQNLWLPRAALSLTLTPRNTVSFSWGQYGQFPEFRQLWGEVNNPALRAERSTQYVASVEHRLSDKVRFRVEAYNYQLREGIYSADQEFRMARPLDVELGLAPNTESCLAPRMGDHLHNALTGYSRGIEFVLQRRSANRLSGWISYSLGYARFQDPLDQLNFPGDYDQRHTLNAYGSYRFNKSINLSVQYRYGSNFPLPGFYQQNGNSRSLVMTDERNQLRLPAYSRLDVRIDKAFYLNRRKLTLYAEVNNILNRSNEGCRVSPMLRLVPSCDGGFPILPAAGLKIEF